jgi:uncharacterized protein YhaN
MRLRRLDLTRYGKFTDQSLDFGAAPPDGPDFHIIYGPNEAGKSTTMQGWLDLLFGIPAQSRMNFLHPYGAMQLGAVIETGTDRLDLIRTKGRVNTLNDPAGTAVSEAVLQGVLAGIERAGYEAMFSLDDETLEKGGESILSSQGDLGQMLFTASSGLAEMGQALDGLRSSAQGFFKAGGRSGRLSELKKALAELEQQIAAQDTGARDFAHLAQARDQAHEAWAAAQAAQDETVRTLYQVERHLAALPLVSSLGRVDATLSDMPDLPPLPQGWADELTTLLRDQAQITARRDAQQGQMASLAAEFADTVDDPAMLALAGDMAEAEAVKSAYDGAVSDLPHRQAEADEVQARIDALLRQLDCEGRDPAEVLPAAAVVATLRGLMERHSGMVAAWSSAQQEAEDTLARLDSLVARLDRAGGALADPDLLDDVMQTHLRDDPEAELARAQSIAATARDRLAAQIARLAPWQGDAAALEALHLPAAGQVQDWRRGLAEASAGLDRSRADLARLQDEAARLEAQSDALEQAGTVPVADAAAVRALREKLWAAHRARLDIDSADRFEEALRRDDQITAAQSRAQTEAQQRNALQERLAMLRLDIAQHDKTAQEAAVRLESLQKTLRDALPEGLPQDTSPDALESWINRRETALEALADLRAAERAVITAQGLMGRAQAALAATLAACGLGLPQDTPLSVLAATARGALQRARDQAALVEARATATQDLSRRRTDLDRAEKAMQRWQQDWQTACAQTFLGQAPSDVAGMGETLDQLQRLERLWGELRGLRDRIAKMQANRTRFAQAVAALAGELELTDGTMAGQWGSLTARLRAASDGQARRAILQDKIASGGRGLQGLQGDLGRVTARLAEMCSHLGCDDAETLQQAVAQAQQRQDLLEQRAQLEHDVCEGMDFDRLADALDALEGLDRAGLLAERDRLVEARDRQAQALQQLYAARSQADDRIAAIGGDDAVARLHEERQTLLLEIAEEARAFLRQRLGILAVDHALQGYRDSHRSAMMQRASDAFRTITRGEYGSLAAQPEGDREVLVAIGANGASKLARDLSKGTRFQLYLALRVAGYHEISGARSTVPFIADDILETFDDDRAAETFALLAGMGRVGQVIYLTHHRHLCRIAQEVCPDVKVHYLG